MTKKTKKILIILIVTFFAIFILGTATYLVINKEKTISVEKETNSLGSKEKTVIEDQKKQEETKDINTDFDTSENKKYSSSVLLDSFMAAYKAKNAVKMFEFFTKPQTDAGKNQQSLFLYGKDINGNPGGPQLFQTNIASGVAESYLILRQEEGEGGIIMVRVKEARKGYSTVTGSYVTYEREAIYNLIKSDSELKIDAYYTDNCLDKYCGFLS